MSIDIRPTVTLSIRVAEEIRALLARRKISGRDLARRLSVSPNWVSLRTSGSQPIDLNDLERIARALDVEVIDLLPAGSAHRTTGEQIRPAVRPGNGVRPADKRPPTRAGNGSARQKPPTRSDRTSIIVDPASMAPLPEAA